MNIKDIDHLTITTDHLDHMMRFYHEVFDLPIIQETKDLLAFQLGHQKLIFTTRKKGEDIPAHATGGSTQFCVIAKDSLKDITNHLANYGIDVIKGPVATQGANGKMNAIYVNDPEQNVIEICEYDKK